MDQASTTQKGPQTSKVVCSFGIGLGPFLFTFPGVETQARALAGGRETWRRLTLPTQRRAHRRSPDGIADRSQTSITIDVADIAIDFHEQLPSIEKVHRETSYT
jgi:hypothetical protein